MKKKIKSVWFYGVISSTTLLFACNKMNASFDKYQIAPSNSSIQSIIRTSAIGVGDTILTANYETNTTNSGISGINPTNATASDAAYTITPGRTGNHGVAHKATLGLPEYYSSGAYRSESDADKVPGARFVPGNERRYEFSINLKDWEQWVPTNPPYTDVVFQCKVTAGSTVPILISTKRNSIVIRYSNKQYTLINDFRPQINQWIDFRMDVLWADTTSGYVKVYTRYAQEQDYTLRLQRLNEINYFGNAANHGYIKWGVYRESGATFNDNALTRIIYHDNVRIIALN